MSLSLIRYTGDGSTTQFDVPFGLADRSHLKVRVNGSVSTYTWVAADRIQLPTAPSSGATVELQRSTPLTERSVVFSNGSVLTGEDLNTGMAQLFYVQQELRDLFDGSIQSSDGSFNPASYYTRAEVEALLTGLAGSGANLDITKLAGLLLGSAANPSLAFDGDPNTGLFSPEADALAVTTGGTERLRFKAGGGITPELVADAVGYLGLPIVDKTSAYAVAASEFGKCVSITTGGVTIPSNASVALPKGFTIGIFNNSASPQTISITSDTLRQAGTTNTGSRTLAAWGVASLVKMDTTLWVIQGNLT